MLFSILKNFGFFALPQYDYWRPLNALGFLIASMMLGAVLYLQVIEFVAPCFFCVYLRLITLLYGMISFVAMLYRFQGYGRKIYMSLLLLSSVLGIVTSSYLIWLQTQPVNGVMSCGQGIGARFIDWPLGEIGALLFSSYHDCTQVSWTFFGLSLPSLSLCGFIALFLFELGKYRILSK